MKAAILNQCSTNKGDRAVLYAVLRELSRNGYNQVTVSTSSPQYWQVWPDFPDGMDISLVPWGFGRPRKKEAGFLAKVFYRIKFMFAKFVCFHLVRNAFLKGKSSWHTRFLCNKDFLKALKDADVVVSTGGHHITTIIAKSMVTAQVFDMMLAFIYNKPLLLWSQSIGTFDFKHLKDKLMVHKILSQAKCIFIRDTASEEQIRLMGVSLEHVKKTYESVFSLFDVVENHVKPSEREKIMGLSVWTGNKQDPRLRQAYIDCLSGLVNHAINSGYKVRFFPMEMEGYDKPYLKEIADNAGKKDACEIIDYWPTTREHLKLISQCRMFVGHKTHSVVFSLTAGTPLIAIAYHKKTNDFMVQFGLEQNCIDDSRITVEKLVKMFDEVNANLDAISQRELKGAYNMSLKVQDDFKAMLNSVNKQGNI